MIPRIQDSFRNHKKSGFKIAALGYMNSTVAKTTKHPGNHARRPPVRSSDPNPWRDALRHRCGFCRVIMRTVPLTFLWGMVWPLGLRRYYCPHCFEMRVKPTGWLLMVLAPFRLVIRLLLHGR